MLLFSVTLMVDVIIFRLLSCSLGKRYARVLLINSPRLWKVHVCTFIGAKDSSFWIDGPVTALSLISPGVTLKTLLTAISGNDLYLLDEILISVF